MHQSLGQLAHPLYSRLDRRPAQWPRLQLDPDTVHTTRSAYEHVLGSSSYCFITAIPPLYLPAPRLWTVLFTSPHVESTVVAALQPVSHIVYDLTTHSTRPLAVHLVMRTVSAPSPAALQLRASQSSTS